MKMNFLILLLSCLFLTSCGGFCTNCWQDVVYKKPCGACIKDRCKEYCDNCKFNEATCQICKECVSTNHCNENFHTF